MIKVQPFDVYKTYLGLKNHFTRDSYDYQKYQGKSRASLQSFYKRRDRYFFEKLSRKYNDNEIVEHFVSNFVSCDDPQTLWIGEMVQNGEENYTEWKKKIQSMSYHFKTQIEDVFTGKKFDSLFQIEGTSHPEIVKLHLNSQVSLETLIILDRILGFRKDFDKILKDPVWKYLSLRMMKYDSFLHIQDIFKYKKILKDTICGE